MACRKLLLPPLLLLALAQCRGNLSPFETTPVTLENAQVKAISTAGAPAETIGICYNSLIATAAEVRAVADKACGPEAVPQPLERDFRLSNCPLLQPARITFACMPKTK
jgi:hypothetical protein